MKNLLLFGLSFLLITACSTKPAETPDQNLDETNSYPALMSEVWDAHGGIDRWKSFAAMEFTMDSDEKPVEKHIIDLQSRHVRIESDSFTIGMDGERVWVAPSLQAYDRDPRFYHNLMFYFYAIPYVMADPGVRVEDAGNRTLDERSYRALRVSFEEGTGDADDDEYILLIDPESGQLAWLLYTVTYFSGEASESYNALKYTNYHEVNGLLLPHDLTGYEYANDTTGSVRYHSTFRDVVLSEESFSADRFQKPPTAEYAE